MGDKLAFGNPECKMCGQRHPISFDCEMARMRENAAFELGIQSIAAPPEPTEEQKLRAAIQDIQKLRAAIQDIFEKAVPYTTFQEAGEEWIGSYVIPAGPLHRAIGLSGRRK